MARPSKEEIINALYILKSTCHEYESCSACPLRNKNTDGCKVSEDGVCPVSWEINDATTTWVAFL